MRIVHVYKDYFPVLGGIENHIRMLAEAQAAAGHEVTALVCAPGRVASRDRLGGVDVVKVPRLGTMASMPLSVAAPWSLHKLAGRHRTGVFHVHAPYPLGEAAAWLLRRGYAMVVTHHADVTRQQRLLRLWGPVLRRTLAGADRVIATNPAYIPSSPWLAPVADRCRVVPLGIEVDRFPLSTRARAAARPRLLFVGALRHYKGVDVLLDALKDLPDVNLDVIGTGPMQGPWQAHAAARGLDHRVRFRGRVEDAELPAAYDAADLVVLPSINRAEAFGTVLLEAMASGVPVVSTELGTGTSWVNQDGITGRVVTAGDAVALRTAIAGLLADPAALATMGRAGRQRVEDHFTLQRMVDGVEAVYNEALGRA